jgi:large subunit ribosomal protein L9
MQVILLERIGKLGQMGDVVKVRDGYARNFLLPKGKALRATKENLTRFQKERAQLEARNLELRKEAEDVAAKANRQSFTAIRQASDGGQLYGSVTTRDIAELVTAGGFSVDRTQVMLNRPIKTLGVHDVLLRLHPEVDITIHINVARSDEEAERQARGEDVTVLREALEYEHESFVDDDDLVEAAFEAGAEYDPGEGSVETERERHRAGPGGGSGSGGVRPPSSGSTAD